MSGKPMDPERLAHCRNLVKVATEAVPDAFIGETARNLRDALDRGDHWETHAANIEDRLVECAERFAEAGLTGALRVVESAIAGRISNHAAKARVVRLTERAETAEAEAKRSSSPELIAAMGDNPLAAVMAELDEDVTCVSVPSVTAERDKLMLAAAHRIHDASEWRAHLESELDEARAEAKRWRSQCPVTAEHVEAAGLTWTHVDAWVLAQPDGKGEPATDGRPLDSWRRVRENPDGPTWQLGVGMVIHRGQALCDVVRFVAPLSGRSAWDILDEMATATPGGDQ